MTVQVPWKSSVCWRSLGMIYMHGGQPKLPEEHCKLPAKLAGLYWLHFVKKDYHYIGQTRRLRERLHEYRKPTQGTLQEYYIHQALIDNDGAELYVYVANVSDIKSLRNLETNEIRSARTAKLNLLNRSESLQPYIKELATEACKKLLKDWLKGKPFTDEEGDICK